MIECFIFGGFEHSYYDNYMGAEIICPVIRTN